MKDAINVKTDIKVSEMHTHQTMNLNKLRYDLLINQFHALSTLRNWWTDLFHRSAAES